MTIKTQSKRRSMLFCPAIKEKYFNKALKSNADSIIFDLEDSVANTAKKKARENLLKFFPRNYTGPKELLIRINNAKTPFYKEDLKVIREIKPQTICYPKAESNKEILKLESFIKSYDLKKKTELFILIESAAGFFNAKKILSSSTRITATALGTEDLIKEVGIERGILWENLILNHVLINLVLISHSLGIQHIGPIYRGYKTKHQLKELDEECKYLKKMNISGKLAIHPNQIGIINKEFNITSAQIAEAKEKLKRFEEVILKGSAVISKNYEMEDLPSLVKAKKFLEYSLKKGFGLPIDVRKKR